MFQAEVNSKGNSLGEARKEVRLKLNYYCNFKTNASNSIFIHLASIL